MTARSNHTGLTPVGPDNKLALKHGVYSPATIEQRAVIVRDHLVDICPWLDRDEFAPAVARFVRVEARAIMADDYICEVAETKGFAKVPVRLLEVAASTDRLAAQLGESLGLDPLGRARIAQLASSAESNAASLAELQAKGQQIIARRERELAAQAGQDDNDGQSMTTATSD